MYKVQLNESALPIINYIYDIPSPLSFIQIVFIIWDKNERNVSK